MPAASTARRSGVSTPSPAAAGRPVGGGARMLGDELGERRGNQFVGEDRPGAAGNIGAGTVAGAAPDGYTLLINASIQVLNRFVLGSMPFDPDKDFLPITLVG